MTIFYDSNKIQIHEKALVRMRRQKYPSLDQAAQSVGVALSGGGIRSATFCLGVFQAIARCYDAHKLSKIHKIDYLSTVSGGGYFGAFLGSLFTKSSSVETVLANNQADEIKWLRENGRYLSPNGGGDLLRAIALMLRNWLSIQIVMACLGLLIFFSLHWLEHWGLNKYAVILGLQDFRTLVFDLPAADQTLWLSAWSLLPFLALLLIAIPSGWAYWMVIHDDITWNAISSKIKDLQATLWISPLFGMVLITGLSFYFANNVNAPSNQKISWMIFAISILTWFFWIYASTLAYLAKGNDGNDANLYADDKARHWLTSSLKLGLLLFLVLLVLAVLDTLAKTVVMHFAYSGSLVSAVSNTWAGLFVLTGVITPFVDRIFAWLSAMQKGKNLELSLHWAGQLAGFAIVILVFVSIDATSYAVFWNFPQSGQALSINTYLSVILACLLGFSWLFGRTWSFLNRSSLHALYSSRLARAYLGANNQARHQGVNKTAVVDVMADDMTLDNYYKKSLANGAPLHLINITVNQTVDSASQIQQQDRKGFALSIGPAGYCLGGGFANSHATPPPIIDGPPQYQHPSFHASPCEDISLGQAVAISGAAFSTGMGEQTGVGLSLLAGFFNLRLGYWWDAHGWKKWEWNKITQKWERDGNRNDGFTKSALLLSWLFPTQSYIINEYLARFHGPSKNLWNLSDGGHFENMGGYELIRRKIPRIIIIDAEADPDYQFKGLGNLVRKVRIDFNAEMEFCSDLELDAMATSIYARPSWLGTLEDLKKPAKAYAAIAKVNYPDDSNSLLLYIKPSLIGVEPRDVLNYYASNPDFPQQSTADQFFDEAQWESYRKLGDLIGKSVFNDALIEHYFM